MLSTILPCLPFGVKADLCGSFELLNFELRTS
jgi:hypothetical protein